MKVSYLAGGIKMHGSGFYVRLMMDTVPEEKRATLAFREERNYPALAIDTEKNRLLLPDDTHRLIWVPLGITRFVKLA